MVLQSCHQYLPALPLTVLVVLAVGASDGLHGAPMRTDRDAHEWTAQDRERMRQAVVSLEARRDGDALKLLRGLYAHSPYHEEAFTWRELHPGEWWPDGGPPESDVAGLLSSALFGEHQFAHCLAVTAARAFHATRTPLSQDAADVRTTVHLMRRHPKPYAIVVAVNDLWVDSPRLPVLQEEQLLVPLAELGPYLHFEVQAGDETKVELRRKQPPLRLVFEQGKREVMGQEVGNVTLERAPMKHEGALMVPAAELAKLLDGEAHWYPEVRFMHLIIPKPKPKDEPAEQ